jgi:aminoglycoside phosphotransferase (APT) family kinase protein
VIPSRVRSRIEQRLHGRVRRVSVRRGGFSPGFAGIIATDSGNEAFVKVGSSEPNPAVPVLYRREWSIASALPPNVPAPRALWSEDDGEWVVLAFEAVHGRNPRLPWRPSDLDRVVLALEAMSGLLTPAPIPAPSLSEHFAQMFRGFRRLAAMPARSSPRSSGLDPWIRRHLKQLADWEGEWEERGRGPTLLHNDVRADNIVLEGRRVYFVDWPHACVGPAWFDLMSFLPSVAMQGGPRPWEVFDRSALARDASPHAVRALLAATTGYFVEQSLRPPPPGLPTLRAFQRAQGVESLRWLRRQAPELR